MIWALAIGGALLGLMLAAGETLMLGFVAGGFLGYLLAAVIRLRRRVNELEDEARARQLARPAVAPAAPAAFTTPPPARAAPAAPPPPAREAPAWAPAEREAPAREPAQRETAAISTAQPFRLPESPPNRLEAAFRYARLWLTTGNVPVKLGVIISFFGVAFLLKYAVERRLFVFPIEYRLLSVAAVAAVLLAIGWRLRNRKRVYALSLQGGGLGILYLTTFTAFRLYELIPPVFAFALLVVLTVAGGALAVLQNARGLATLGAVGGFLAPVLVSTGAGNHVVLFSYYLVLNALILGVAWYRPWRELNLIGFGFTFVVGGMWAADRYEPAKYASTQPFVILFFLFYQAVAILFARRSAPLAMKGIVDGTLVFGTPVLVFAMQALMLKHSEFGLAYSALAAALFYAVTATLLDRERSLVMRLLIEAYLALAVAFATLAIPLALDARWTAAGWALEGAALVWIGVRQQRTLARLAGTVLVFAAGLSFMDHGWRSFEGPPVLNGNLLGGWLIAIAALVSSRMFATVSGRWQTAERVLGFVLMAWGFAWWAGAATVEILERADAGIQSALVIATYPLSALLLTLVARKPEWKAAGAASCVSLVLLALLAVSQSLFMRHPFADWGFVAWPAAIAIQYWLLWRHAGAFPVLTAAGHAVAASLTALVVTAEVQWQLRYHAGGAVWPAAAASFVPGLLMLGIFRMRGRWPVAAYAKSYTLAVAIFLQLIQWSLVLRLNGTSGDPAPLPFLPFVNPADLATGFALLCTWSWLRETGEWKKESRITLGAAAFLLSTVALLRGAHHLGGVPWDFDAMLASVLVQAAISVYWGLLAFAAMTYGARRAHRGWWMAGAALMGLVVVKLFLVELGNTGTVARIVSFIAIGGLLLVLGYIAPAPPRGEAAEARE